MSEATSWLGAWAGAIDLPDQRLEVRVRVTDDGAALDVPAQLAYDVPLDVAGSGDEVSFTAYGLPGTPTLTGSRAGKTFTGSFTQGGASSPVTLERSGEATRAARPQEPVPPLPYLVKDVEVDHGAFVLAGTLTTPEGAGPAPGVLLLSGSGSHDRDESIAGHRPFLVLADALTRAGIAVLRLDDRGVGGSGGEAGPVAYNELAADALVNLRHLADQPAVDGTRLAILGHSQGGNIATIAATRTAPGTLRGIVLLAAPAVGGAHGLEDQMRSVLEAGGAEPEVIEAELAHIRTLIADVTAGDVEGAVRRRREQLATTAGGADTEMLEVSARAAVGTLQHVIAYDPADDLGCLQVPLLAVYGTKDLQVAGAVNAEAMRVATNHLDAATVVLHPVNHLMQPTESGLPTEYAEIATTIEPTVLSTVVDWVRETLNR